MIQPIAYTNTNFTGHVKVSMQNNPSKGIEEILSKIPEGEDREAFREEFDSFTKQIEEGTPDDTEFDVKLDYDDWCAGGTLLAGKGITFTIKNANGDTLEKPLCKKELPILRKDGTLWKEGKSFKKELNKFFYNLRRTAITNFNFREAVENNRHPKQPPKKSLLDEIS